MIEVKVGSDLSHSRQVRYGKELLIGQSLGKMRFHLHFVFCGILMKHRGIIFILIISSWLVLAQNALPGQTITDLQGLPSNTVTALACDSKGMIWIGTYAGLASYDGQQIVVYETKIPEIPAKLKIDQILLDSLDNIWINCTNGLLHFDTRTKKFSAIKQGLASWRQLCFTTINKKRFVFYTLEYAKSLLIDPVTKTVTREIQLLTSDSTRLKLTDDGIFAFPRKSDIVDRETLLSINAQLIPRHVEFQKDISTIRSIGSDRYLVQSITTRNLLVFDSKTSAFETFINVSPEVGTIKFITPPNDGLVFVGTSTGLFTLDLETKNLIKLSYRDRTKVSPIGKHAFTYTFDKSGNLFVGHAFSGITFIRLNGNKFESPVLDANQDHMPFYMTRLNGQLYVSRQERGIEVYDNNFRPVKIISHDKIEPWEVSSVLRLNEQELMISCFHQTIVYNSVSERNRVVFTTNTTQAGRTVAHCDFPAMAKGKGYTVFSHYSAFYRLLDGETKADKLGIEFRGCPAVITYWHDDKFLVAHQDKVLILDVGENQLKTWLESAGNEIINITILENRDIALGSRAGLLLYSPDGRVQQTVNASSGLTDDMIYSVSEGGGKIWMSTNRGISSFDRQSGKIENYAEGDGLQGNEFNRNSVCRDEQGYLYFGGINGITRFKPEAIENNKFLPRTVITHFSVNDIPADSLLSTGQTIHLDFKQNTLSFEFASLEFTDNKENDYLVFLDGVDKDWVYQGARRFTRYPSLAPGEYTLQYKSTNNDGHAGRPNSLRIVIEPPWYKTNFALASWWMIGIGLVMTTIWIVIRIREREKNQKIKELEKLESERTRISQDLHDNLGSLVSFISSKLSWVEKQYAMPEGMEKEVSMLKKSANTVMTTLRETIWTLATPALLNTALADKLKTYARSTLTCKVEIQDDLQQEFVLPSEVVLSYYRVVQEIINNINKHSQATLVSIQFHSSHSIQFQVSIRDNGVGLNMSATEREEHYGMRNIMARVKEVRGVVNFNSEPGEGLKIDLQWNG